MSEKEYIERGALIADLVKLEREYEYADGSDLYPFVYGTLTGVRQSIIYTKAAPAAADVVEARHGTWTFNRDGSGTCSRCHFTQKNVWDMDNHQNFCGVCGAKMDGERKEQT